MVLLLLLVFKEKMRKYKDIPFSGIFVVRVS